MDAGHASCLMCSQNCRRIHQNVTSFPGFAHVVKAQCLDNDLLLLPSQFVECAQGMLEEAWATQQGYFYLEGPSRIRWPVAACKARGALFRGWRLFASDHSLQLGDILFFRIIDPLVLAVSIFDCDGNERKSKFGGINASSNREEYEVADGWQEGALGSEELEPPAGRGTRGSMESQDVELSPSREEDWTGWKDYLETPPSPPPPPLLPLPAPVLYRVKEDMEVIDLDMVPDSPATPPKQGAKRALDMVALTDRGSGRRKLRPGVTAKVGIAKAVSKGKKRKRTSTKRTPDDPGESRTRPRRTFSRKANGDETKKETSTDLCLKTEPATIMVRHTPVAPNGQLYSTRREVTADEIRQALTSAQAKAGACTNPTCTVSMAKSHVLRGFWLGLPEKFCRHLGKRNVRGWLEDSRGRRHGVKYIIEGRNGQYGGLSAGWRGFAASRSLDLHDVCVFELVDRFTLEMKVHIFRVVDIDDTDLKCKHSSSSANGRQV